MLVASYYTLRVCSLTEMAGKFEFSQLTEALDKLHIISTPVILNMKTITTSLFVGIFTWGIIQTVANQNKKNLQENTYGSAEWEDPKVIKPYCEKELEKNQIFTATEMFAKNMRISKRNRHLILIGRPGSGKSRYYFKVNLLNANGETFVVTDPNGKEVLGYILQAVH